MEIIKFDIVLKHKTNNDIIHEVFNFDEIFNGIAKEKISYLNEDGYIIIEKRQFTGLTDKNGKEIYEGDILKYYDDCWEKYTFGRIIWEDSTARFTTNIGEQFIPNFVSEIIGNIYKNSELLKS